MIPWMIVEDEPDIYEMLLAMVELMGHEGLAFIDGEDAVAWIEEVDNARYDGELPELALIDIRLPGELSGPLVSARLRHSPILGRMPVILITAYKLSPDAERDLIELASANLLMYKPLPALPDLQRTLGKLLDGHK